MSKIKTIGILTSGGDAPGMNAAIRAVTRAGIYNGFKIKGIYRGYEGLIHDEVKEFTTEDVSGIITRGGTILKSARSKDFMTPEGRQKAYETCKKEEIDALIVIGGNVVVDFLFQIPGGIVNIPPDKIQKPGSHQTLIRWQIIVLILHQFGMVTGKNMNKPEMIIRLP